MNAPRPRIAALVPAYNEAPTIGGVVSVLVGIPLLDEVIVVCDGCTDETAVRARAAGATTVVELERNRGKGGALFEGLRHTQADVLVLLDADLKGLTADHIERLVYPVLHGSRYMNIGLRDRGRLFTAISAHLPLISGERALKREVMDTLPIEYAQGFMIETALNYLCRVHRWRYGTVVLHGLSIRRKHEKVGFRRAAGQYLRMYGQVIKAMCVLRLAHIFRQI